MHVDQILKIFQRVEYSLAGSNRRQEEEDTFSLFIDYLDECEKGKCVLGPTCQKEQVNVVVVGGRNCSNSLPLP